GLRRRCATVDVQAGQSRAAGWDANVGRAGGYLELSAAARWRLRHRAARGDLWTARRLGGGKPRNRARRRSGERSGVRGGGPRRAARESGTSDPRCIEKESGRDSGSSAVSELSQEMSPSVPAILAALSNYEFGWDAALSAGVMSLWGGSCRTF